ncbi:BQ5605_C005g03171 [Microbotryum silenes-dioicae]|uniref:BQ5605_C005g03171 protein n=1 Tax=Microbotryum silenes-dioicae TaxID=796604 RepID=A0A2X0MD87_9BASI|nr:BQ5605_C005g03171 [Microbotryum silenes-dioicae]
MLCLHSRTDRSISQLAAWTFATGGGTTRVATLVKAHEDGTSIAATDCCPQEGGRRLTTFLGQPQISDRPAQRPSPELARTSFGGLFHPCIGARRNGVR